MPSVCERYLRTPVNRIARHWVHRPAPDSTRGVMAWPCRVLATGLLAGLLSACGTTKPPRPGTDGPGANPPANLASVPDAVPRLEPIRPGGPNKPYEVLGRTYVPITHDKPLVERGLASWYGRKYHGQPTSSGEPYDMYAMTAAHPVLPIPSYALVRNPANGREVVVRINDRGPFVEGRIIDLSYTAATKLDLLRGVAPVELVRITPDDIRAGRFSARAPNPPPQAPPPRGYWLQLGAFSARDSAEQLQRRAAELAWLAPQLRLAEDGPVLRVLAGPYAQRAEASRAADQVRESLNITPWVHER